VPVRAGLHRRPPAEAGVTAAIENMFEVFAEQVVDALPATEVAHA
jgi:hypothetical protein